MSSSQPQPMPTENAEEQTVTTYLLQHADFFERNPQLLTRLRLYHPRSGATISLIERQVEQQLVEFVRVARANDQLAEKIHVLTRRLLRTANRAEALAQIEASLRESFDARHAVLVLPGAAEGLPPSRLLRSVPADDPAVRSFETLFAAGKPRCGQVRDSQREFLFGAEAADIGSVALVPLMAREPPGLLALGSVERDRFHPGMSTEFLMRMGELIADALGRV
jgi:uncharacterized protein